MFRLHTLIKKAGAELTPGGGVTENGSLATPISSASNTSISNSVASVNGKNVEPDSLPAQEFQKFDDNVKQILADMFVDMSMDAGEKLSTIKAAGMTEKITTDKGGVKYKLPVESKTPTYQELVNKEPIAIINIGRNRANLSYAEIKKQVLKNANDKKVFDKPHLNKDTGVSIFLTSASYSHAFSNPTADFGVDTLLAMDNITEIIHEAVLTHIEPPKNPRKAESRVLTLFAAIEGENGVEPIKLKVKEYSRQSVAELPRNIREYFENNGNQNTHHRLYDAVALEVVAIEGAKKESGASASVASQERLGAKGTPNSTIKISELLDLVNGDAKKYVPQKETGKQYKLPVSKNAADRGMLVDLFEQMVTDSNEYRALQNYKKNIDQMLSLEEKVQRLTDEIKRVSFSEGSRNMEHLDNIKQQRKQAVAELNKFDNILLGLEKSGVLRAMIERNRKTIQQETRDQVREYYRQKNETREAEYKESRQKAVERHNQTEVRQRIRKDVQRILTPAPAWCRGEILICSVPGRQ